MTWPWQSSVQARILLILGGLLSAVLLLVNLGMAALLERAQLEESADHLQIQALIAARNLADPLSGYHQELEEHEEEEELESDGEREPEHSGPGPEARGEREDHEAEHPDRRPEARGEREDHEPEQPDRGRESHLPAWAQSYGREAGAGVLVTDPRGRPLAGGGPPLTPEELEAALRGQPAHRFDGPTVYASAPIVRGNDLLGVVRLSAPRARASARSRALSLSLLAASLLALSGALVAAVALSRRLVAPLKQLEGAALRAARGEWDQVVPIQGQDEVARLSRAFATMLSELRRSFERQRRFVTNASHELRTPLTRIKLRTEALVDGGLDDRALAEKFLREVDSEADRMGRLANSLLDLARLEEGHESGTTAEVVPLLRSVASSVAGGEVALRIDLPESLPPVRLSPESLELVVRNLLDNALRHTPPGGEVRFLAERTSGGLRITVEDTGCGIASEHLPHLFERFYRVERGGGGTGLGLALVKAAAEAAGGSVQVSSEPGRGSRFTVELPAA